MAQITGRLKASAKTLSALHLPHARRHAICTSRGIRYRHVICPNKESVEVKRLPDAYQYEQYGPTFLRQYIEACLFEKPFYDREILRSIAHAYFLTDSHWTEVGALAYLRTAATHFGDDRLVQRLDAALGDDVVAERQGDLGEKLGWPPERFCARRVKDRTGRVVFANKIVGEGHIRLYESNATDTKGTCAVILHDSFVAPIARFIAECYERTLFILTPHLDIDLLARFEPSVLWFFQVERFVPLVSRNDISLVDWVAQQERRKGLPTDGATFLARTIFA